MKSSRRTAAVITIAATAVGLAAASGVLATPANASATFIGSLRHTKVIASTTPANGDVNPYGVAVIPRSTGNLHRGDVLVSNFNDKANVQGTGTTIVQVSPRGKATLFAQVTDKACPGGVGLTTALVALRSGWVIVGSLPTRNGVISGPGCLIALDQWGHVRTTIAGHGIDGPWDMTALDQGNVTELFVTNVLGGILGPVRPPRPRACWRAPRSALASRRGPTRTRSSSARRAWASAAAAPCTSPTRCGTGSPPSPAPYSGTAMTARA
jgi:hypothetical protein